MIKRRLFLLLFTALLACDDSPQTSNPIDSGDADAAADRTTSDTRQSVRDAGKDVAIVDASPDVDEPDFVSDPVPGSVRFYGNGGVRGDRILIRIDDPADNAPGPPIDVGTTDFTIEFWMRAQANDNPNPAIGCGATNDWVTSNIIIDRDRHSQPPSYGIGIADSRIVWAVQSEVGGSYSNCGQTVVTDDDWHHVAVGWRTSDGRMWIFVDGTLDFEGAGPAGDVSYPDDGAPMNVCPDGVCDYSDPFLVFGAEKHGYGDISYNGFLDEVRISTGLRYTQAFARPNARFQTDAQTVGLYHFDEGSGATTADSSGVAAEQSGEFVRGGQPEGPDWSLETPF